MYNDPMGGAAGTYSFFDHAADVGIRVRAASPEALFAAAGRALMEWIGPRPAGAPSPRAPVSIEAADREELLVRWLQELLCLFHLQHAYFVDASPIEVGPAVLRAVPLAAAWDEASCSEYQEVKAVTYHKLRVAQVDGEWQATVILDI